MKPSWYMYGTEGTSFENGRTSFEGEPGAHGTYFRAGSNELFVPPYTWTMRMKVRERLQPFLLINGVTVDWYSPAINFFPMHLHDEGIATCVLNGLGGGTNERGYQTDLAPLVSASAKKKDPPPRGSYGVASGYESRFNGTNFDPCDGEFHDVRIEVLSYTHYQLWWDEELKADIVEREPATMAGAVGVGLRLDFYDVEIQDEQVIEEPMTEFVPIYFLKKMYEDAGLTVNILPGAAVRGARMYKNGYENADCRGLDIHHTAQSTSTSDAASIAYMTYNAPYPVMCNVYPHKETPGMVTICAAGPTYTAGAGGPLGDVPKDRGNKYYWSMECPNNGVGEPWPTHLQETMVALSAVNVQFFSNWGPGWSGDKFSKARIPAHFEYAPNRKIDPFGPSKYTDGRNEKWDMDHFRRDVAAKHAELYATPPPIEPPPIPEEDVDMHYLWKHTEKPGLFWFSNGAVVHVDQTLRDALLAQGVPRLFSDNDDVYHSACRASGYTP